MPSIVTCASAQTPLRSSIVALSSMTGMDAAEASGFSRLSVMVMPSSETTSMLSCSAKLTPSAVSTPSCIEHRMRSPSPFMCISAVPSAPIVMVRSMPMSASG